MSRLEVCIEALETKRDVAKMQCQTGTSWAFEEAIAIITRILSAEPTEEEIERASDAYWNEKGRTASMKAALMTVFGGRKI